MRHPSLQLIPGGNEFASTEAASATISAYIGRSIHPLRGYASFSEAQRDRDILAAAGIDASVTLGVVGPALFVLVVPVSEYRRARRAFMDARRAEPTDRPARSRRHIGKGYKSRGHQLHVTLGAAGIEDHAAFASSALGRRVTRFSGISAEDFATVVAAVQSTRPLAPARREGAA